MAEAVQFVRRQHGLPGGAASPGTRGEIPAIPVRATAGGSSRLGPLLTVTRPHLAATLPAPADTTALSPVVGWRSTSDGGLSVATISESLAVAVKHHQAGELQCAERIYRQVLQADPSHADALHLLGVLAHQMGKHELAVEHMRRAIASNPHVAAFHSNLGSAYSALGKLDEAVSSYQRALQIQPRFAEAHNNLGNALKSQGRLDEAVTSSGEPCRSSRIMPSPATTWATRCETWTGLTKPRPPTGGVYTSGRTMPTRWAIWPVCMRGSIV
jgi:hypothetical protein